jgi:hypothetical protein
MKRSAVAAFLLLAALGVGVEGADLPKPTSMIQRHKTSNFSGYIRGAGPTLPRPVLAGTNDRHRNTWQTHAVRGK